MRREAPSLFFALARGHVRTAGERRRQPRLPVPFRVLHQIASSNEDVALRPTSVILRFLKKTIGSNTIPVKTAACRYAARRHPARARRTLARQWVQGRSMKRLDTIEKELAWS